jgi:hypothetical protein
LEEKLLLELFLKLHSAVGLQQPNINPSVTNDFKKLLKSKSTTDWAKMLLLLQPFSPSHYCTNQLDQIGVQF